MHPKLFVAFYFISYIVHCILSSFHTLLMAFVFLSAVNYGNYSTTGALPMFASIVSMIVFHISSFFVCNSCMVYFLLICIVAFLYLHSVFICVNDIHIWGFILHSEFFSMCRRLFVCFLYLLHVCI